MKDKAILQLHSDEQPEKVYGKEGGITKEHLQEARDYLFGAKENKTERGIKIMQYCKTNGTLIIDTSSPFINLCSDSECDNCRHQDKIFREQVDIMLGKWKIG